MCSHSLCFSRTVRVKRLSLGLHRQQWASVSFWADPEDAPADAGVVLESLEVLQNLQCVTQGCVMLFGFIYALNLNYPKDLKCTFEAFQKIIMELDAAKLSQSFGDHLPLVSNNCNHIQYLWIFVQVILLSFVQKWPYFCLPQVCLYLSGAYNYLFLLTFVTPKIEKCLQVLINWQKSETMWSHCCFWMF